MRRGALILVFLFALVFSISGVSAQVCGPGGTDQLIMRLSNPTDNSHGELWNANNYPQNLCFNDLSLFGSIYPGASPHVCLTDGDGDGNPDNLVIRLSAIPPDDTNSHGEAPDIPISNYLTDVCYGDLVCVSKPGGTCDGLSGEVEVLRLSSTTLTNSHLEYPSAGAAYPISICCTTGGGALPPSITDLRWEDSSGGELASASLWHTVFLAAYIANDVAGTPLDFEIFEDDCLSGLPPCAFVDDDIRTAGNNPLANPFLSDGSGTLRVPWTITQADLDAGDPPPPGGDEIGPEWEFYFSTDLGGSLGYSTDFPVPIDGILVTDDNPVLSTTIVHKGIYFVNTDIDFVHSFAGTPGLSTRWVVETETGVEIDSSDESFIHQFTTPGQRTITIITDDAGDIQELQLAITIIGSPGMIAYVNEPFHLQVVENDDQLDTLDYSTEDSYVIRSDVDLGTCAGTMGCLAGSCPTATENAPVSCGPGATIAIDTPAPPAGTPGDPYDYSLMDFQYTTYDDVGGSSSWGGFGDSNGQRLFLRSNALLDRRIDLMMTYDDTLGDSGQILDESHYRIFNFGQCINNGATVLLDNIEGEFPVQKSTLITGDDTCDVDRDGVFPDDSDCCPAGSECTAAGCVVVDTLCPDYPDQFTCEEDADHAAENDPLWGPSDCETYDSNGNLIKCYCDWISDVNGDRCEFVVDTIDPTAGCSDGACFYSYTEGECTGGYMFVTVIGTASESTCNPGTFPTCDNGLQEIPCGRLNVELGFFDYTQFFVALMIIFVIYLAYYFRSHRKKRR
jgi:hypothetical protein